MKKVIAGIAGLMVLLFSGVGYCGMVYLGGEGYVPDVNEEVTVVIDTNTPLLTFEAFVIVEGDAEIISATGPDDCNQYGWSPIWGRIYDDVNSMVYMGGFCFPDGIEGPGAAWVTFRYHSGEVVVSIVNAGTTCDVNGVDVPFSTEVLVFGEGEQIRSGGGSSGTYTLPALAPEDTNKPHKILIHCPENAGIDSNSREQFRASLYSESNYFSSTEGLMGRSEFMMEFESEPNIVWVDSDISTSQIWTADNVYYLPVPINVYGLLVIEPGTLVVFGDGYGWYDCGIDVKNGGTLISKGTPDAPIVYTCEYLFLEESNYVVGEYWKLFFEQQLSDSYYLCAISVEHSASPATTITYNFIEGATLGIATENITLDRPIENNYLFGNLCGIFEYGTRLTDIKNNLCYFNYYTGIEACFEDVNGVADANSVITIANNTCDKFEYEGIYIHGVDDINQAGTVNLINNLVSESYCGLCICDYNENVWAVVSNTGYYDNWYKKNDEFTEYNPVEANDMPYVYERPYGCGGRPFENSYLKQTCPFINAGADYIEQTHLIGMTTDVNNTPDSNFVDIGFHYANWDFVNANSGFAESDFGHDTVTDYKDLSVLILHWLENVTVGSNGDLDNDANVNFVDYALWAANWQKTQGDPNIVPTISWGPNNGYADVGVSGFAPGTLRVFLFVDGKYAGEVYGFDSGETIPLDISALGNGTHVLKEIGLNTANQITCSDLKESSFNYFLSHCVGAEAYEANEPYHFSTYYTGTNNITVEVYDRDDNVVWSNAYLANNVNGVIPASVMSADNLDSIVFTEATTGGQSESKPMTMKFNPKNVKPDIRALIISPSWGRRNFTDVGDFAIVEDTCKAKNVPYYYLMDSEATYEALKWFGQHRNIQYIYYSYHGGYKTNEVLRTKIELSDGIVYSAKQSDGAPSWCKQLPGNLENTANTIKAIGFPSGQLKFVHFDCCYTGRLELIDNNRLIEGQSGELGMMVTGQSDMSWALGMDSSSTQQIYQGWWNNAVKGEVTKYNIWTYKEWSKLQEVGASVYTAIAYAYGQTLRDNDPNLCPHENFRLMGSP